MTKRKKGQAAQQLIDSLLDDVSQSKIEQERSVPIELGASVEYSEDGKTPTLVLSDESGGTSHLSLDANTGDLKPDPVTVALRAERTRLAMEQSQQAPLSPPPSPPKPENPLFDLVTPPIPSSGGRAKTPPFLGTKPMTKPEPDRIPSSVPAGSSDAPNWSAGPSGSGEEGENTVKLDAYRAAKNSRPNTKKAIDPGAATEIRPGLAAHRPMSQGGYNPSAGSGGGFSSAAATLKQSESLRIAQGKITELEGELERLRRENEQLSSAGETLRRRTDELNAKAESIEAQAREASRIFDEEKKVLRGQLAQKDRDTADLRQRLDEMENRLDSNFKKIRVRERELEHRLEIVKMESATLVSTKDKMILDLKRQIDQLTHENEYGKQKTQELFSQYKDKQETIRRVVRALRIALTILEGDEDHGAPVKKAE